MLERLLQIVDNILNVAFFIILAPLIFAMFVIDYFSDGFKNKCKFHNVCPHYSSQSHTCTKEGGFYGVEPAQCYRKMEKRKRVRRKRYPPCYSKKRYRR